MLIKNTLTLDNFNAYKKIKIYFRIIKKIENEILLKRI
jgi:hypothetical protein